MSGRKVGPAVGLWEKPLNLIVLLVLGERGGGVSDGWAYIKLEHKRQQWQLLRDKVFTEKPKKNQCSCCICVSSLSYHLLHVHHSSEVNAQHSSERSVSTYCRVVPFSKNIFFSCNFFKYRVELLNCAQESFLCFGLSYIIQNQCNEEKHCAVARIKNTDRFIDWTKWTRVFCCIWRFPLTAVIGFVASSDTLLTQLINTPQINSLNHIE